MLLAMFDEIISERMQSRCMLSSPDYPKKKDLLEVIIDLNLESDYDLRLEDIKHFLLEQNQSQIPRNGQLWNFSHWRHSSMVIKRASTNLIPEIDASPIRQMQATVRASKWYVKNKDLTIFGNGSDLFNTLPNFNMRHITH
ncbi:PREDICTED: uncharacterized protein LOC105971357 [Erythranthe guttata]|uniref:uncharacterized protein LOC105971357 n=1 Tax=Erythranthe guttata TaxID=4155 RepID=UPI00064DF09B|nr:PREDICTED: uncharacterized protein LOC105971357 [Erythranthe guttata]|eukprot:XP_012851659.1 PREDICTED: uncharacterized protein LOC105971357 [Erythranthe guttata]